ncbi:MAG: imidazole glycerol phosphate synthase subunit HisF [Flavobacteriales bacterium]|nr:imidazole glycerol phosphate synthase subunit HisF [Flavobacteriales bacterium]
MFRPRVIPVLLLQKNGLVKTIRFKNGTYIGDPINAVKIFNELKVDEIVLLDIDASKENRSINIDLVREIGEEANMPFSVGGGIKDLDHIKNIITAGAERVILNSYAINNPDFVREAADRFGSSTISVCIDYKKNLFGKNTVYTFSGEKNSKKSIREVALSMQQAGAGEIILQSIDKDGSMAGYDLELIKEISALVTIPVIALGGAGSPADIESGYNYAHATGLAAGSFFVFKGKLRGVLIQYPDVKSYRFT